MTEVSRNVRNIFFMASQLYFGSVYLLRSLCDLVLLEPVQRLFHYSGVRDATDQFGLLQHLFNNGKHSLGFLLLGEFHEEAHAVHHLPANLPHRGQRVFRLLQLIGETAPGGGVRLR